MLLMSDGIDGILMALSNAILIVVKQSGINFLITLNTVQKELFDLHSCVIDKDMQKNEGLYIMNLFNPKQ